MFNRTFFKFASAAALTFASIALYAQTPAEPTAYKVTMRFEITGTAIRTTYRLGSKVLVDVVPSPGIPPSDPPPTTTRTLYFLDAGRSVTWDRAHAAAACTWGSFHGDEWQDPFSGLADLAMPEVKQVGSETILGIATKLLVSKAKPGITLWVDPKTGLMLKSEFTAPSTGKAVRYFEVTEVSLEAPAAVLFEIPARCGAGQITPQ